MKKSVLILLVILVFIIGCPIPENDPNTPGQVSGFSGVIAIAAGLHHTVALKNDRNTPVQVSGLSGVIAIATGGYQS